MPNLLRILLYGLGTGLLLLGFVLISSVLKYACSLIVLFLGMRFFSAYDQWRYRIAYIVLAIIAFFIWITLYVILAYVYGWPLPGSIVEPAVQE